MYLKIRRVLDIFFAILLIMFFSPLMFLIAMAIKADSNGPVFFKQGRLGIGGKEFTIYKFRTMIENAEKIGTGLFNYKDDFRVTSVGRILRLTSLDELPQLFNILKGDMAFIGPRPPVTYELGNYEDLNEDYKKRFTVPPGISGLAQVRGRNEISWDEKVRLDNQYIDSLARSGFLIDLKISFLTILKVLSMKGTYEVKPEDSSQKTGRVL